MELLAVHQSRFHTLLDRLLEESGKDLAAPASGVAGVSPYLLTFHDCRHRAHHPSRVVAVPRWRLERKV